MSTFAYIPSYGAQLNKKPKVQEMNFGDGYTQRIKEGINNNPEEWSLSWDSIDDVLANAIMDFFDAVADGTSFNWTNPRGVAGLYWCPQYSRTQEDEDKNGIKAAFKQVYGA
jgi:phage-related protein